MPAVFASDSGEAVMEDAAIQETINYLSHIGPEKAKFGCKPIVIDLLQRLKVSSTH